MSRFTNGCVPHPYRKCKWKGATSLQIICMQTVKMLVKEGRSKPAIIVCLHVYMVLQAIKLKEGEHPVSGAGSSSSAAPGPSRSLDQVESSVSRRSMLKIQLNIQNSCGASQVDWEARVQ